MDATFWITSGIQVSVVIVLILILTTLNDLCYAITTLIASIMYEHERRLEQKAEHVIREQDGT